tara:strand:+ start:4838 stop:5893 length:1056 start_codon:yes stop_codon:yes gene_type:complete
MLKRALHSIELSAEIVGNSQWVQLLPLGTFTGYDGRGPYINDEPEKVIEITSSHSIGRDLPVDYDHQSEFSKNNGMPAPAAGWFKKLEVRADGIYAQVEWTDKALAAIQLKEFRYISPVYLHDPLGNIKRIESAGLTNKPNLQMKALSSQQPNHDKGHDMKLEQLLKLLGLDAKATTEQISAHAQKLVDNDKEYKALMSEVGTELELGENATKDDLVKAVQAMNADDEDGSTDEPDPSKYVPMAAFTDLQDTVKTLQSQSQDTAANSAVEKALADQKISPAQVGWAKSYHKQDPSGFAEYIKNAPALNISSQDIDGDAPGGDGSALNASEKAVCAQLDMSEEDFIKSKGAE